MKKRKDDREYTKKDYFHIKRKLLSTFTMFLIAAILMASTSYAWFVLSVAPEVSGISTSIGANGSLEMALLTTETKADLNTIKTSMNESLAQNKASANNTWGNLVDLSYAEYGLGTIMLMPARLTISPDGKVVQPNLLSVPTYGFDGRIIELIDDTMSAVYKDNAFTFFEDQDYGVRAIGTADTLGVQGSALALAKANTVTFSNNAKNATKSLLGSYGDDLFNIVLQHSMQPDQPYNDTNLDTLKALLANIDSSADYIDRALRQGLVAVAASEIADKATFEIVRDRITGAPNISSLLDDLQEVGEIPEEFRTWVNSLSAMRNSINAAIIAADSLSGGAYTWAQFRGILDYVMNIDGVYINDKPFSEFGADSAGDLIASGSVILTLAPGSGIFADIADFTGNYNSSLSVMGINVDIKTASAVNPAYLDALVNAVKNLEAADGGATVENISLGSTYGYAIDLAFRCNAAISDLLLQTTPEHRIYDGTENGSAMGGGSFMQFSTDDNSFSIDKMAQLIDAVRVAFLDDKNNVLGIAKLNTSNREILADGIKASLYLYEYGISAEDGSIVMGERRLDENAITSLEQNVAKAITAVVWLDGDIVDNTMVSATKSASLTGVLNLQFASSANLVPASNNELLNISANKNQLEETLSQFTEENGEITLGQRDYTNVSWKAFVEAYDYAVAVSLNPNANDSQVYFASAALAEAKAGLEKISTAAVEAKVDEIRDLMGTSDKIANYIIKNKDGSYSAVGDEDHTQETHDSWNIVDEVYQVDYKKNLHDEGNELFTQIYTDESWNALANALYDAEETLLGVNLNDNGLDAALTALDNAQKGLQRRVFYTPYEYNGAIYYEAICEAGSTDTYGKWYDSDFKRIFADITILNLDAYAVPVNVFKLEQGDYVSVKDTEITPFVEVLSNTYPTLLDEEIKGMHWNISDSEYYTELISQRHINTIHELLEIVTSENLTVNTEEAAKIIGSSEKVTAAAARNVINALREEITAELDRISAEAEANNPLMTDAQRTLLTAAINSAKAINGYDDPAKTELQTLRNEVNDAETLLAEVGATKTNATNALEQINAALKNAEAKEITEYNTLTHKLTINEIYDIVYDIDYPGMILELLGKEGEVKLDVAILTESGIVSRISKTVTIYTPAKGIEPVESTINLTKGTEGSASVKFSYDEIPGFPETFKTVTWASDDMSIAAVEESTLGSCKITAKKEGYTYISVSVVTEQGHTYTARIIVNVTP